MRPASHVGRDDTFNDKTPARANVGRCRGNGIRRAAYAAGSSAVYDDWRNSSTVTVGAPATTPVTVTTFTTSATTATPQTPVVFTASAAGGTGAHEYRFALYDAARASWMLLQNYATTPTVSWTPGAAGTYWVQVWVRSVGSTVTYEDWRNSATVTVAP